MTHSLEKISKIIRDLHKVQLGDEYNTLDKFIYRKNSKRNLLRQVLSFYKYPYEIRT